MAGYLARLTSSSRFVPFFRGVDRLSDPSGLPAVHQTPTLDTRAIVWLDIDHTLYGRAQGREISRLMKDRIHAYFVSMGLPDEEATRLHKTYYSSYGLAIRGLVKHHDINALDYDRVCDASLPLEDILSPDPALRELLSSFDPSKTRVLCLTNAYKTHALRVLDILGIQDLIQGIAFCDYGRPDGEFGCKPEASFFMEATAFAMEGKGDPEKPPKQYFVDDSLLNANAAAKLGWNAVHFKEAAEGETHHPIGRIESSPDALPSVTTIDDIQALREVWKELFL